MIRKLSARIANLFARLRRDRRGAALVEYSLLVAGISLISLAAVSILGHKTSDLIGTTAMVIPGAHTDDNNPIQSGHLVETAVGAGGAISINVQGIIGHNGTSRLDGNVFGDGTNSVLVTETQF